MALTVRTITEEEVGPWVRAMRQGFLGTAVDGEVEMRRESMDLDRSWGALDGNQVVGTLRSFPQTLTVPGGEISASALTNVTVATTHRRRGLLTEMITGDLGRCRDREEPLGILIASEYPIYGRFGYGAAIEGAAYSLDTALARFRDQAPGTMEFTDLATLRKEAPAVYDRHRIAQPGAIARNDVWWDRVTRQVDVPGADPYKGFQALYRSPAGEVEGFVQYTAKTEWIVMRPTGEVSIEQLVAATDSAYQRLWQFCADIDMATTVTAPNRSVDELLPWLLHDARMLTRKEHYDFVWVRIVDPAAALAGRTYLADGELTIEVVDDLGLASGTFVLTGGPSGATCTATTRSPDLVLPVRTLGSIYMGGYSLSTLARAGQATEARPGALAVADAMFRSPVAPWCATWF